jgi:hypothetical protein
VGGGGLSLAPLHLSSEQVQQVASGFAPGDTLFTCYASVSFSFSTFLRFAATSWAGVDKNTHTICAKQPPKKIECFDTVFGILIY